MAKICVLEWDAPRLGERQRAMIAFADAAKQLRHRVVLWTNDLSKRGKRFLEYAGVEWLNLDDVRFGMKPPTDSSSPQGLPSAMRGADAVIVPYGDLMRLTELLPQATVAVWAGQSNLDGPSVAGLDVWVDSQATACKTMNTAGWYGVEPEIVVPPQDYTAFRDWSRSWADRRVDAIVVNSLLKSKRIPQAIEMALSVGVTVEVLGTTCLTQDKENQEVIAEIRKVSRSRVNLRLNLTRHQIARRMSTALCLLTLSVEESAPLTAYEALNAGCIVVGRKAEALSDQTGSYGYLSSTDTGVKENLCHLVKEHGMHALEGPIGPMERGRRFDRPQTLLHYSAALNRLLASGSKGEIQ